MSAGAASTAAVPEEAHVLDGDPGRAGHPVRL